MSRQTAQIDRSTEGSNVVAVDEEVDGETPLVVVPRGGCREVGRSCYQVETPEGRYLVDCGINQGDGGQFPDFRGLEEESIDAVFLTHAHIDHTGALPVLEHRNLLASNADIICTQGTAALADILLRDSLKIHTEESNKPGRTQHFTRSDVEDVIARFDPLPGYDEGAISHHIRTDDSLQYQFGDAAHLLGSAWLALEGHGRRIVFSGDLGGRSAHLKAIEEPPTADTLILESTYGTKDTHSSFRDARTTLYQQAIQAHQQGIPVLIPTFAVGRAQEILQIFRERWRDLDEATQESLNIIYDGMAQEATDRYHAFASPDYINESVMNYMQNAADFEPFVPDIALRPEHGESREKYLRKTSAPVIVAPSGMLSGGLSPAYLLRLLNDYDEIRVLLTGYQAEGTLGRELQRATDTVETTIETWPIRPPDNDGDDSAETESKQGPATRDTPEFDVSFPAKWVQTINGLSGHAARNKLLQFARHVDPDHVALVHGDPTAQDEFITHLESNLASTTVTRTAIQTPLPVYPPDTPLAKIDIMPESAHPQITIRRQENVDENYASEASTAAQTAQNSSNTQQGEDSDETQTQESAIDDETVVYLRERIEAIEDELVAVRNDDQRSEAKLREIIQDEVKDVLTEHNS